MRVYLILIDHINRRINNLLKQECKYVKEKFHKKAGASVELFYISVQDFNIEFCILWSEKFDWHTPIEQLNYDFTPFFFFLFLFPSKSK